MTSHWLYRGACHSTLANQSTASLSDLRDQFRDEDVIHGPGRPAFLQLGLRSWWKGNLERLLVVAAACLRIKATRGREVASSSHCLIVVSSHPGTQMYTLLPFLFGQTEDLTLTVKGC